MAPKGEKKLLEKKPKQRRKRKKRSSRREKKKRSSGKEQHGDVAKKKKKMPNQELVWRTPVDGHLRIAINEGLDIPKEDRIGVWERYGRLYVWNIDFLEANEERFSVNQEFTLLPDQLGYEGYDRDKTMEMMQKIVNFLHTREFKYYTQRGTYYQHTGEKQPTKSVLGD